MFILRFNISLIANIDTNMVFAETSEKKSRVHACARAQTHTDRDTNATYANAVLRVAISDWEGELQLL